MGYKPKYAQNSRAGKRQTAAPLYPRSDRETSKKSRGFVIFFVLLGLIVVPLSSFVSFEILKRMAVDLGRPKAAAVEKAPDMLMMDGFDAFVAGELSDARTVLLGGELPQQPEETVPEETSHLQTEPAQTLPPMEERRQLAADTQVAPEPNQALFGETEDPAALAGVLKQAETILEGQELFFSTDVEIFAGSTIRYYLDESIFAITWKEARDRSVYTFSEVKVGHPSQLRRHLSDGEYGSGKLYLPTEMAATVNAVVATSGDFYANRPIFGIVAYEGQVRRDVDDGYAETCYIDHNGNLIFSYMKQLKSSANAQAFLDENNINFSLAFGPILVDNYEIKELGPVYGVGEIREEYARSALCQMDELHYLIAVANWEGSQPDDPTVPQFQKVVASTGCRMAYCLDGGQTAAVVMNDQLINRPAKGEQRRISDIIYFATAVPEGGGDNG